MPEAGEVVEREVRIAARPETVFAFFTDPAKMLRWKGVAAELDPRPGGTYRVRINEQSVARGEYVEVVPNSRVVFTWGWEGDGSPVPPGTSTVEVSLIAEGEHTVVRLRHRGLPADQRQPHAEGWAHYLERLVIAGAGGDPGPDPWASPASAMG
ncbi:MAG: SRPBCC domain-containing protein [Chloroflexi bacterium]|nr:SRPBCC domain-containing protein [Chloroflexota bacterium]